MWPAHVVTLLRIPIGVAFWFVYGNTAAMIALIVAAAVTDAIDGNLARYLKARGATRPDIGGWLDPLVDKVFVAIVIVAIGVHTHAWIALALVAAREWILVPLSAIYVAKFGVRRLHADALGKVATIAQFAALALIVGASPAVGFAGAVIAACLGLAAVAHYLWVKREP